MVILGALAACVVVASLVWSASLVRKDRPGFCLAWAFCFLAGSVATVVQLVIAPRWGL